MGWGCGSVVESLPGMWRALFLTPSPEENQNTTLHLILHWPSFPFLWCFCRSSDLPVPPAALSTLCLLSGGLCGYGTDAIVLKLLVSLLSASVGTKLCSLSLCLCGPAKHWGLSDFICSSVNFNPDLLVCLVYFILFYFIEPGFVCM